MGNVGAQEIQEKLKDYKIRLDGKYFMTALVTGDDLTPFLRQSDEYKSDLACFAIYNISAEIMDFYQAGVSFQDVDERTVLIFSGNEGIEELALKVTEEIHDSIFHFLKVQSTIGLGGRVGRLQELPRSFQEAKRTLEYKFVPVSYTHLTLPTN